MTTTATTDAGALPLVTGAGSIPRRRIEEATTNGARDPSFENGILANAYDNVNGVLSTANPRLGTRHLRCAATTVGAQWWVRGIPSQGIAASAGQTWTFSAYIHNRNAMLAGQEIRVVAVWVNGVDAVISNPDAVTLTAVTGGYTRFSGSLVAPAGTAKVNIGIATNGIATFDFDVDTIQVEQTTYETSYCDGSLGTGYAWTGAAHASTSTRAAGGIGVSPSMLSATQGALAVWLRPQWAQADATGHWIVDWLKDGTHRLFCRYNSATNQWDVNWTSGVTTDTAAVGTTHSANGDVFLVMQWSASLMGISLNGGALATVARTGSVPDMSGGSVTLGRNSGSDTLYINSAYGPLYIFDRPLTQAEIVRLFNNGAKTFEDSWGGNCAAYYSGEFGWIETNLAGRRLRRLHESDS